MYLTMLYAGYTTVNNYSEINNLYTIVNSASYDGTSDQKHQIDSLKTNIIEQIKISPRFKSDVKSYILDSLRNITIKFANPTGKNILKKTTGALYMKLGDLEKSMGRNPIYYPLFKLNKTSTENIIIVNKMYENDDDLVNTLVHEIYHYVDALLGQKGDLSVELNLPQFIDKSVKDKDENYIHRKYASIFGARFNKSGQEIKKLIKDLSDKTINHIEYLSSAPEIFARWKTFKSYMVKKGYIKDMNSPVDNELFIKYISTVRPSTDDIEFLLAIDWNKISELDKISM